MKILGIVAEYNPFHTGHLYHLNQAKKLIKPDLTIVVMSSSFVQRGEPAIISKYKRAQIAVDNGVDIVIELPFVYAVQSADYFAYGAITLLNELGVTDLVFGSEDGRIERFISVAQAIETHQEVYDEYVKQYMSTGMRYPDACNKALSMITGTSVKTPNDLLGLAYVKEIIHNHLPITPHCIMRTNDYHDDTITQVSSATALRNALIHHQDVKNQLPGYSLYQNDYLYQLNDFYPYLRYSILFNPHLSECHLVEEGLDDLLRKVINRVNTMDELINALTSKRYTRSRIQRMLIHILMNNSKQEIKEAMVIDYIRLLGLSIKGQKAIKDLKSQTSLPIITKISETSSKTMTLELKACQLLSLIDTSAFEQEIQFYTYRQKNKD